MTHVNFPTPRHFELKSLSLDYPSYSVSLVKTSAPVVELLSSNDVNIIPNEHENHIIILSFLVTFIHFCSLFLQYLKKGKKQNEVLIDSEARRRGLQNYILLDIFRGELWLIRQTDFCLDVIFGRFRLVLSRFQLEKVEFESKLVPCLESA